MLFCFILAVAVAYIVFTRRFIIKKARKDSLAEQASAKAKKADHADHPENKEVSVSTKPDIHIDVQFENLNLTIPDAGVIMRGVSGSLTHGRLAAVMGPSGAGKSTFLAMISGKVDRTGGTLKVNGEEKELTSLKPVIGFVPQNDIMLRELTVEENIRHSALMRLPATMPLEEKLTRVQDVIETLDIGHIRDSVIGDEKIRGISGGQIKRVNIALEMVIKPSLLCLDEPTSGLDSTTSLSVIQALKDMANTGVNVVAVLHQPKYEIFKLFDDLLLLGKGGMTVYQGPAESMSAYFGERGFPCPELENPADYYMDVIAGIIPHDTNPDWDNDELLVDWMCAPENQSAVSREDAEVTMEEIRKARDGEVSEKKIKDSASIWAKVISYFNNLGTDMIDLWKHLMVNREKDLQLVRVTPGYLKQTSLLFKRVCLQRLRRPWITYTLIILHVIAGAILPILVPDDAILYKGIPKSLLTGTDAQQISQEAYLRQNVQPLDAIPGILVSLFLFMSIVSCTSVNIYGGEKTVFFRECSTGQYVTAYWTAKTMDILIWLPIYTMAFLLLGYFSAAWLIQPLWQYYFFLLFTILGFYGIGMIASLMVDSAALLSLVLGLIIIIVFSGTNSAFGDMNSFMKGWSQLWFLFWAAQGICVGEYNEYKYAFDVVQLNSMTPKKAGTASFGEGQSQVGSGVGKGWDMNHSVNFNLILCFITALFWQLVVLWTLKIKDRKKHR